VPETCLPNGPLYGRGVSRDRRAAYLIVARRLNLHIKAEYIDADFLHLQTFPLQSDGGPYIAVSSIGTRAADAAHWLTVELLFTHSQQTGRRLALKSKYLIDPNL
jgi:hypothetical protein